MMVSQCVHEVGVGQSKKWKGVTARDVWPLAMFLDALASLESVRRVSD